MPDSTGSERVRIGREPAPSDSLCQAHRYDMPAALRPAVSSPPEGKPARGDARIDFPYAPAVVLRLYDYLESGNAYKVRLLLSQLGIPFERVELDILRGETRTPAFLAKNPNHRIPLLEWPDGRTLAESNAILCHLAEGTPFLPEDPFERAQALQWMFFEQYSHEPYVAVVRFWHFSGQLDAHRAELAEKVERGYHALSVMERHLAQRAFFAGERYSVADIALYAYTHVADEGDFELARFPATLGWLERVRSQPGHVRITDAVGTPVAWPAG